MSAANEARVTAEEFSQAVAALEARRREHAHYRQETVAIGEIVGELDLDITAEEILDEVRAQRNARCRPRRSHLHWDVLLVAAFVGFAFWLVRFVESSVAGAPPTESRDVRIVAGTGSQAVLKTLSEISDGQPVRCAETTLDTLLAHRGIAGETSTVDTASGVWTVVKYGGEPYVRGWIATPMSDKALEAGSLRFFASDADARRRAANGRPVPLTLKTDRIRWEGEGGERWRLLTKVRLDERAHEPW